MTPRFLGLAEGWCDSRKFETHKMGLVWEGDDRLTCKHVEFAVPAGGPSQLVQWAVDRVCGKLWEAVWAADELGDRALRSASPEEAPEAAAQTGGGRESGRARRTPLSNGRELPGSSELRVSR